MTVLLDPAHPVDRPSRARTLLQVFLTKKEAAGRAPSTIKNYAYSISHFVDFPLTPTDPRDWADTDVDAWLAHLRAKGQSPASIAHHRKHLLVFLTWLTNRGELADFRARIEPVTVPESTPRTATKEHLAALLLAAGQSQAPARNTAILAVLWSTGMRRGELARLDYEHVDVRAGTISLPGTATKSHRRRIAIIDNIAKAALLEWFLVRGEAPGPLWRTPTGERLSADGIRQLIAALAKRAKIEVSSHDFRRAFASRMLAAGLDPVHTAQLGGWDSLQMMTHYARATRADAAVAAARRLA